jgi:hypothetical protein
MAEANDTAQAELSKTHNKAQIQCESFMGGNSDLLMPALDEVNEFLSTAPVRRYRQRGTTRSESTSTLLVSAH